MSKEQREKAIEVISRDPNRLVKTNPIINAKFDITAVQMKVFLKVIASVDQSNEDLPDVQISLKEFQDFVGGKTKNLLKYLQEELTKLRKKDIYYEDDKIKLEANFFSSIVYDKVQAKFIFEFSNKLKPFLLQIKENFTVLDIRNLLFLNSIYAIRFYEFCKQYERFGAFELDVEDLKDRLGLSTRYKNYFDFKLKVLQQARTELESSSDLYFDFEEIKSGKKVVRLRFIIIENRQKTKIDESLRLQILEIHMLVKDYVTETVVNTWFKKYPYAQILAGVEYTLKEIKLGKVHEPARYLQKMVSTKDIVEQQELMN
jgi:plasmid replication initiation protein